LNTHTVLAIVLQIIYIWRLS